MKKELENQLLILYAILTLGGNSNKKQVLDFLEEADLIILNDEDQKLLKTRKELKWRNELAYTRQHLVEIEALNKYEWSITASGKWYYNSLIDEFTKAQNYIIQRIKKTDILQPIPDIQITTIKDIYQNKKISSTDIVAIILSRKGQGRFKKDLVKLWQKCCVTGYDDQSLLIASHIKPWKYSDNTERLDKYNGFLLTPNLDKLFDGGLITFNVDNGQIIISNKLKSMELFGVNPNMKINLFEENKKYLTYHNLHVFEKKIRTLSRQED